MSDSGAYLGCCFRVLYQLLLTELVRPDSEQVAHLLEALRVKEKGATEARAVSPYHLDSFVSAHIFLHIISSDTLKGRVRCVFDTSPAHRCFKHVAPLLWLVGRLITNLAFFRGVITSTTLVVSVNERLLLLLHASRH